MPVPTGPAQGLTASASGPLIGRIKVPGDRAIAQRALLIGALAIGETRIDGLPEDDVLLSTIGAIRAFGAPVTRTGPGAWHLHGLGVGGFLEPDGVIDLGSAATGLLLTLALAGSQAIATTLTGDDALLQLPLGRILDPLRRMGAQVITRSRDRLPLTIKGPDIALPIEYRLTLPSAEVKSAVLLAGLNTPGVTTVIEPIPTPDHTETMLAAFGAGIEIEADADGARIIRIEGRRDLKAQTMVVPGDPSLAGFPIVAALLIEGSDLTVEAVLLNPLRIGLIETLIEMGGDITVANRRTAGGEAMGDVRVRSSRLNGVHIPAARASLLMDDYFILAIAAAFAKGKTVMEGLGDWRSREPDRAAALTAGLIANGIACEEGPESLTITGSSDGLGGGSVKTHLDHRLAMGFLVLGLVAQKPVTIDDGAPIVARFSEFQTMMTGLGAHFETAHGEA